MLFVQSDFFGNYPGFFLVGTIDDDLGIGLKSDGTVFLNIQ